MKVVIIGGVAGGATAAARLRRLDEAAEIIVIERSGHISYANCGLPYYIGGEITDPGKLTLQTPESFYARFRIDVRVKQEAEEIDPEAKTVKIRRLEDDAQYVETYDKLILSPGARPVVPPFPGVDHPRVMTLRTVEDTFAIEGFLAEYEPRTAVVIGGGFIGLEMAENLKNRGLEVTLIEKLDQVMLPFDEDMAALLHNQLRRHGICLRLSESVRSLEGQADHVLVNTEEGNVYPAQLVVLAVGVTPENTLANKAGLKLGVKGAIAVNESMQTSDPDIYAVGDAVEVVHRVTGQKTLVSLAGPANKQGRIAADHICGLGGRFSGAQGSSVLKVFDMTAASTGINERTAKAAGIDCDAVILAPASHATYYPGASAMTMKVVFEKTTGRILGGQIAGFGGVDKRIDVLAAAIHGKMTAFDLTELELAYAPPYSSAKDPVNMAGYIMENLLTGKVRQRRWEQLDQMKESGFLLDVRTLPEYQRGNIEGAYHIPVDELRERMAEVPKDRPVYVHCQSGLRSYLACRILEAHGYTCYNIAGGYGFYEQIKAGRAAGPEGKGPCGL